MESKRVTLFLVFFIRQVTSKVPPHDTDLLGSVPASNSQPLIVYVNAQKTQNSKASDFELDDLIITGDDGVADDSFVYETEAKEQAKYLLYNYLNTGPDSEEEYTTDDARPALRELLRSRCQAKIKCEKKCKKRQEYCPKNCKAVFDSLDLCDPPKPKRDPCKKQSSCGWGKTMPPKWFKF